MATKAACPLCKEIVTREDFLSGRMTACPHCGISLTAARLVQAPASPRFTIEPLPEPAPTAAEQGIVESPLPVAKKTGERIAAAVEPADDAADESAPASILGPLGRLDPGTVVVFVLGGLAAFLASIPSLAFLTSPLALLALFIGVVCLVLPVLRNQANLGVLAGVCCLCLFTLIYLSPRPVPREPPRPPLVAVPLKDAGMIGNKPIAEDDWMDAGDFAIQRNDFRVRVLGVKTGFVEFKDGETRIPSKSRHLMIEVQVIYDAISRPSPFTSWADRRGARSKNPATLTDNRGQPYPQTVFDSPLPLIGQGKETDLLTPGHMGKDLLIFSEPAEQVESLRLELPGAALDLAGSFRFLIPRKMIQASP